MKISRSLGALLLAVAAISPAALTAPARGATYFVAPDGSGDYPSIQVAIDMAAHGDSINLADGIYRGAFNNNIQFWGKRIVLSSLSDDPTACILDCEGTPEAPARGFRLNSGENKLTVVRGITISNGYAPDT